MMPATSLNKESALIWNNWNTIGLVDVVHESAVKGTHIELAYTYLSQRKHVSIQEVQLWYKSEIIAWIQELLKNKQIYRVTHILRNVNVDPDAEIQQIMMTTTNLEHVHFLAKHLETKGLLNDSLIMHIKLMDYFHKDHDAVELMQNCCPLPSTGVTLNILLDCDNNLKQSTIALLFLKYYDPALGPYLVSHYLWSHAVLRNDKTLLKTWIQTQFSKEIPMQQDLAKLLQNLKIEEQLIHQLLTNECEDINEFIFDTISNYGMFNKDEVCDIKKIMLRTAKNKINQYLEDSFSNHAASLNYVEFCNRLQQYCIANSIYAVFHAYFQNDYNDDIINQNERRLLIKSCNDVVRNLNNKEIISNNILLIDSYIHETSKEMNSLFAILELYMGKFKHDLTKFLNTYNCIVKSLPLFDFLSFKLTPSMQMYRFMGLKTHMRLGASQWFVYRCDTDEPDLKLLELKIKFSNSDQFNVISNLMYYRPNKLIGQFGNSFLRDVYFHKYLHKYAIINDYVATLMYSLEMIEKHYKTDNLPVKLDVSMHTNDKNMYEFDLFSADNEDFVKNYHNLMFYMSLVTQYDFKLPVLYLQRLATHTNWMEFLFITQAFGLSHEHIAKCLCYMRNSLLYSHLSHSLAHDVFYQRKAAIGDRNVRRLFFARIGLYKQLEFDVLSSIATQSSSGSNTSGSGLADQKTEVESLNECRTNVLQVLIHCHSSTDPPKSLLWASKYNKHAILSIFATTYEPDSVVTCWLMWLSITSETDITRTALLAAADRDVTAFLSMVLKNGCIRTMKQSFHIFLYDNPLRLFMDFLAECFNENYNTTRQKCNLMQFHKLLKKSRKHINVRGIDHELLYLHNYAWIEATATMLLSETLNYFHKKPSKLLQLLENWIAIELQSYFMIAIPNLSNLHNLYSCCLEMNTVTHLDWFRIFDPISYDDEIRNCINNLITQCNYTTALNIAVVEHISMDDILLKKWSEFFKWNNLNEDFCHACDAEFRKYFVTPDRVAAFYLNMNISDIQLRYKLLASAYAWCNKVGAKFRFEIELRMWRTYLKLNDQDIFVIDTPVRKTYLEINSELEQIAVRFDKELSAKDKRKLDYAMEKLLNAGSLHQAMRIGLMFCKYSNRNIDILRLCYSLAEGMTSPTSLTRYERSLLQSTERLSDNHAQKSRISFRLSNSMSYCSTINLYPLVDVEPMIQDTLSLLVSLTQGLSYGLNIGEALVKAYRISMITDTSYDKIFALEEPMALLLKILTSNCKYKIDIVRDFFCTFKWDINQISDFLCEQLITSVNLSINSNTETLTLWDINLDQEMHLILQLLPENSSILGRKLYNYSSALHKSLLITNDNTTMNISTLTMVIELLILSHDCYTCDCNMEGISVILKKCQTFINLLLGLKNWSLMVRLLTGIGRYNELNYVFHILHENDQFEFLLRKGSTKDNGLRVALLEYLTKYCPDNRSLYEMVALYFSLYSEVAEIWEQESLCNIKNLIAISRLEMINRKVDPDSCIFIEISNTDGTQNCLKKAMENYKHAAVYHLHGYKLAKAICATQHAELIALQIYLVKSVPINSTVNCILNLTTLQVSSIVTNLSFQHALIVTEAYNHRTDWALAIFDNYILKNDRKFYESYLMTFHVTDNLVHDISRHFITKNVTGAQSIVNMKELLHNLPSIHVKYKIASELGFSDVLEELLNSDKLNYLKDTVWRRGYGGEK